MLQEVRSMAPLSCVLGLLHTVTHPFLCCMPVPPLSPGLSCCLHVALADCRADTAVTSQKFNFASFQSLHLKNVLGAGGVEAKAG